MYGSESNRRNGASASTRSRTFRRISSRLSGVTSSLNGSLPMSPRANAINRRRRKPPSTIPPVPSYDVRLLDLSLRVVEFLLPRFHIDIGVRHLAEIYFGATDRQVG